MRILAGVGAWLLGVVTATAGSLLAVSLLGQGIADSTGQQLTTAAVDRALAHDAQEASAAAIQTPSPAGPGPPAAPPAPAMPAVTTPGTAGPAAAGTAPQGTPAASRASASPSQGLGSTVLTSQGGTVLAECRPAGAYLVSWSPTQGYEATGVFRGPSVTARVVFASGSSSVTMMVSCPDGTAGVPVASSSTGHSYYGGDE